VATSVCELDFSADAMRQRHLDDFTRKVGALCRPIAKRRAEAVHGQVITSHALEKRRHSAERLTAWARKQKRAIANRKRPLEHRECGRAERNAVFTAALHARRWDLPNFILEIDLIPCRAQRLARAGRGQDREFERGRGALVMFAKRCYERRDLPIRQCRKV